MVTHGWALALPSAAAVMGAAHAILHCTDARVATLANAQFTESTSTCEVHLQLLQYSYTAVHRLSLVYQCLLAAFRENA